MMKAILFDLDGTLLDTIADIRESLNGMLRAFSYPELSLEQTRACIGDGARKLVERALPSGAEDVEACYRDFRKRYVASENLLTKPFDGAAEFLAYAKVQGVKLAVVTNKPHDVTVKCVEKFFPETFGFVGGDSGMFPCKPDPTLARFAALSMRVSPAECAFVGDGETDVKTAIAAEMRGVAALWGYRGKGRLEEAGATEFASDFNELRRKLFH